MPIGGGLAAKSSLTIATPWTVARQAPLCMDFSRQEYRSVLPFPSPGDLLNPGIKLVFLGTLVLAGQIFTTVPPINVD